MNKILQLAGIIKLSYYRILRRYHIKFNLHTSFHPQSRIAMQDGSTLLLGHSIIIAKDCSIKIFQNGTLKLSDTVSLQNHCYLEVGKNAALNIGKHSFINSDSKIVCLDRIMIGNNCAFGSNISIYDHDHIVQSSGKSDWSKYKSSPITISDNVWIGSGAYILRGANIEHNAVIGANTTIKSQIPAATICYNKPQLEFKPIR